jgi:hypothetical protein
MNFTGGKSLPLLFAMRDDTLMAIACEVYSDDKTGSA